MGLSDEKCPLFNLFSEIAIRGSFAIGDAAISFSEIASAEVFRVINAFDGGRLESHFQDAINDVSMELADQEELALDSIKNLDGRLPQDVMINPEAPPSLPTNRPIGLSGSQNEAAQREIMILEDLGYYDFRVNQQQVNAAGERVGNNRPDVQATTPEGVRVYIEYDTAKSKRGENHRRRILANDPLGIVILRTEN